MSKILSISLSVVKVLGLPLALSGCFLAQNLEQVFMYELRIENKLAAPIAYCDDFEAATCPNVIQSGGSERVIFSSHIDNESDEQMRDLFDRQKIKVCGKIFDFKLVRSVSPVIKRDKNHFEVFIDRTVTDKLCQ